MGATMDMGSQLAQIVPELWLAALALLLVPFSVFLPDGRKQPVYWVAIGGLLTSLVPIAPIFSAPPHTTFGQTYAVDPFAAFFKALCVVAAVLVLLISIEPLADTRAGGDVPTMIVLATAGMEVLAAANDLALIALGLQIVTVASYILVGMVKEEKRSAEASLKFFLFSATAGAVMLYGMSFLYGLTGSLNLVTIARMLPQADLALVILCLAFILVGYGYEITFFPFHAWVPDTYQGAATPITAFLSIGPKAVGLGVLVRTTTVAFAGDMAGWPVLIAISAAVTMTFGNVVALRQTDLKRLLAYSSIAQAGYMLMGAAAAGRDALALSGLLVYLGAYLLMNLGAFGVVSVVEQQRGSVERDAYRGLGQTQPFLALAFTLCLLSLAGVPPLVGFIGKTILFGAAIGVGFGWLAVIAALNTAISLYYYARILVPMYLQPAHSQSRPRQSVRFTHATAICLAGATLCIGIFAEPLVALAQHSISVLH